MVTKAKTEGRCEGEGQGELMMTIARLGRKAYNGNKPREACARAVVKVKNGGS